METRRKSMLNKWDYSGVDSVCYSDVKQESYKKSAEFLGDNVEDWGAGTCWNKHYFKNYRGIDGSFNKHIDEVVDLVYYTSDVDNILMRQTLESNLEWRKVLENAIKSFRKKFCLVIMTPFSEKTGVLEIEPVMRADGSVVEGEFIHMVTFRKQDILDYFPEGEFKVIEETIKTNQGYNEEWILYVEKITS